MYGFKKKQAMHACTLWPTHASLLRCSHLELSCSSPYASQMGSAIVVSLVLHVGAPSTV